MQAINHDDSLTHSFLLSIRATLQYYRHEVIVLSDITPLSVKHINCLLRFLSFLCEGHNRKAQQFLASNNVVSEVSLFIEEISGELSIEMNKHIITTNQVTAGQHQKSHHPSIDVIKWLEKDNKVIELDKITLLAEIVFQGFETLSEFCQGFAFENQSVISRTGPIKHMNTFGKFFGAYQLVQPISVAHNVVDNQYRERIKAQLTHESVISLSAASTNKLVYYGNDPLALEIMFAYLKMPELTTFDEKKSSNSSKYTKLNYLSKLPEKAIVYKKEIATLIEMLTAEKNYYLNSRKKNTEIDSSTLDENMYSKILKFGDALSQLELASITLAQSILEGSKVDEDEEICRIVIESFGKNQLMHNMENYWNRFKSFRTDSTYESMTTSAESCFEKRMVYSYYTLASRFCDMQFMSDSEFASALNEFTSKHNLNKVSCVGKYL